MVPNPLIQQLSLTTRGKSSSTVGCAMGWQHRKLQARLEKDGKKNVNYLVIR